jgi:hypothetical protein
MKFSTMPVGELKIDVLRKVNCKARAKLVAEAFEKMVAALCRGDNAVATNERNRLNVYASSWNGRDRCVPMQVDGDECHRWASHLLAREGLFDDSTEWMGQVSPDGGGFTDVQTDRGSRKEFSIEVKAQLTKNGLGEVTQADYLTGYSDFLAHFLAEDKEFRRLVKRDYPEHLRKLAPRSPIPKGWSVWDLLLAELLGLYDQDHLEAAGIITKDDLHAFARCHYLMHAVGRMPDGRSYPGGARLIRFDQFGLVRLLLSGGVPVVSIKPNRAAVRVSFGRTDITEYTIHVGYKLNQLAKSKLHIEFFDACGGLHIE